MQNRGSVWVDEVSLFEIQDGIVMARVAERPQVLMAITDPARFFVEKRPNWTGPLTVARERRAQVLMAGTFTASRYPHEPRDPYGDIISEGNDYCWNPPSCDDIVHGRPGFLRIRYHFAVDDSNRPFIGPGRPQPGRYREGIGGLGLLMKDSRFTIRNRSGIGLEVEGNRLFDNVKGAQAKPRAAIAITVDDKIMLMLVGSGRLYDGHNLNQTGKLLQLMGARDAVMLDGGGPAFMIYRNQYLAEPRDTSNLSFVGLR